VEAHQHPASRRHHLYFANDANQTLWTSAGGPASGVVGWLNTKMYLEPATR